MRECFPIDHTCKMVLCPYPMCFILIFHASLLITRGTGGWEALPPLLPISTAVKSQL